MTIPALILSIPTLWLFFVMLYASVKVFKWLRTWQP
jgi:hypothetical protein